MASVAVEHSMAQTHQPYAYDDDDDLPEAESTLLSCDYVRWRLEQADIIWEDCPELPTPNQIRLTMRKLADEFEKSYQTEIDKMVVAIDIRPTTAFPKFMGLADNLFHDSRIGWGRIVSLFAIGGALAVQSVANGTPQLVGNVADWVAVFADAKLTDWIQENGGWDGLVRFYEEREAAKKRKCKLQHMAMVGGGVAVMGAVALARMLSSN